MNLAALGAAQIVRQVDGIAAEGCADRAAGYIADGVIAAAAEVIYIVAGEIIAAVKNGVDVRHTGQPDGVAVLKTVRLGAARASIAAAAQHSAAGAKANIAEVVVPPDDFAWVYLLQFRNRGKLLLQSVNDLCILYNT